MKLRTRILVGYGYLITLLVVSAMGAALGFHQLGTSIGQVLEENFRSVRAAMAMLEALERQDSAVLASSMGDTTSAELLERSQRTFSEALEEARANITIAEEEPVITEIERGFARFVEARDRLLATPHERPLLAYESETFPRFEEVKTSVLTLLELNHEAMLEADRQAQRAAARRAVGLGLLVAAAILSLGVLSRGLSREVLARLDELRAVAEALAAGDRGRRATVVRGDELGVIAQQLNSVLDHQLAQEASTRGRLGQMRRLIIALTEACGERSMLLTLTGEVVVSSLDDGLTAAIRKAVASLGPDATEAGEHRLEVGDGAVSLRRLGAAGSPVAWLVTIDEG